MCGDHQTSLHQYQHSQHQLPCYTSQIAEVGSPIVSSTSNQEHDGGNSNSNIGSIITMLIDDQNVNIDDILSHEQYRQDCSGHTDSQPKIKQETMDIQTSDYAASAYHSSFTFNSNGDSNFRSASSNQNWSLDQDQESLISSVPSSNMNTRSNNSTASEASAAGVRDDKYWERRRKNNLAAKKSRDTRRMRENQLRLRVLFLENANKVLREQMDRKEQESGKMRDRLRYYEESTEINCRHTAH